MERFTRLKFKTDQFIYHRFDVWFSSYNFLFKYDEGLNSVNILVFLISDYLLILRLYGNITFIFGMKVFNILFPDTLSGYVNNQYDIFVADLIQLMIPIFQPYIVG